MYSFNLSRGRGWMFANGEMFFSRKWIPRKPHCSCDNGSCDSCLDTWKARLSNARAVSAYKMLDTVSTISGGSE